MAGTARRPSLSSRIDKLEAETTELREITDLLVDALDRINAQLRSSMGVLGLGVPQPRTDRLRLMKRGDDA
jgi:hypothetical protein